jgi:nickel-dependent lactate racemase
MHLEIPYGDRILPVDVDDRRVLAVVSPKDGTSCDEIEILKEALNHPIASKPFEAFLSGGKNVLCIVNDATRPSPTVRFLDAVLDLLKDLPVHFLIATGSHPSSSENDLRILFGRHLDRFRERILAHDAKNEACLTAIGKTRFGTDVRLNRLILEADSIISLGTVEPHYFAGFTGGRKSFLPGCAAYSTIEQNHKLALHPESKICALEGNPVHDDMEEAMVFLNGKSIFSIQVVMDQDDQICAAFSGGMDSAFKKAVQKSREAYCVPVPEPADVVVGIVSPPLDVDLYQAHKALENAKSAINPGGVFILVAQCRQGIGNDAFVRLLSQEKRPADVNRKVTQEYKLGFHKAAKIAEFVLHSNFWALTELDPRLLKSLFIRPANDLQKAIDQALFLKPNGKILFIRSAGTLVPEPGKIPMSFDKQTVIENQ